MQEEDGTDCCEKMMTQERVVEGAIVEVECHHDQHPQI